MKLFHNHHRRTCIMILAIAIVLASLGYARIFQLRYPSTTIYQTELYGANGENLEWLEPSEDGLLTATNADPAINVFLNESAPIVAIRIMASDIPGEDPQLLLTDGDSDRSKNITLHNGRNIYSLYSHSDSWQTVHLRIGLVIYDANFGRIDSITINPASVVLLVGFGRALLFLLLLTVLASLILRAATWTLRYRVELREQIGGGHRTDCAPLAPVRWRVLPGPRQPPHSAEQYQPGAVRAGDLRTIHDCDTWAGHPHHAVDGTVLYCAGGCQ